MPKFEEVIPLKSKSGLPIDNQTDTASIAELSPQKKKKRRLLLLMIFLIIPILIGIPLGLFVRENTTDTDQTHGAVALLDLSTNGIDGADVLWLGKEEIETLFGKPDYIDNEDNNVTVWGYKQFGIEVGILNDTKSDNGIVISVFVEKNGVSVYGIQVGDQINIATQHLFDLGFDIDMEKTLDISSYVLYQEHGSYEIWVALYTDINSNGDSSILTGIQTGLTV